MKRKDIEKLRGLLLEFDKQAKILQEHTIEEYCKRHNYAYPIRDKAIHKAYQLEHTRQLMPHRDLMQKINSMDTTSKWHQQQTSTLGAEEFLSFFGKTPAEYLPQHFVQLYMPGLFESSNHELSHGKSSNAYWLWGLECDKMRILQYEPMNCNKHLNCAAIGNHWWRSACSYLYPHNSEYYFGEPIKRGYEYLVRRTDATYLLIENNMSNRTWVFRAGAGLISKESLDKKNNGIEELSNEDWNLYNTSVLEPKEFLSFFGKTPAEYIPIYICKEATDAVPDLTSARISDNCAYVVGCKYELEHELEPLGVGSLSLTVTVKATGLIPRGK